MTKEEIEDKINSGDAIMDELFSGRQRCETVYDFLREKVDICHHTETNRIIDMLISKGFLPSNYKEECGKLMNKFREPPKRPKN